MRVLVLALSILAVLVSADAAQAGLSTTDRNVSAAADPAIFTEQATQQTEDQIGLGKTKRRAVQRRLTRFGFDTKVNGKFDEPTRAAITRWQEARGYPQTGFLNALQHKALLSETVTATQASASDQIDDDHPARRRRHGGSVHHHRNIGGPIGAPVRAIGGLVGGLFGRR
jgi:peptidoglycan hydrolase-like protein with peptidoglycan-binding domain